MFQRVLRLSQMRILSFMYLRFIAETLIFIIVIVAFHFMGEQHDDSNLSNSILGYAVIWCFLYFLCGLQKDRLRYSAVRSYFSIIRLALALSIILILNYIILGSTTSPLLASATISFLVISLISFRIFVREIIRHSEGAREKENIIIYGTTNSAVNTANSMTFSTKFIVSGFINEVQNRRQSQLLGLPIIPISELEAFVNKFDIRLVVIAQDQKNEIELADLLAHFELLNLSVTFAPTMDRAFDYETQLKVVKPEDVLGKRSNNKIDQIVSEQLQNRVALVTGAGGSIGSEVVRQLVFSGLKKIILVDNNEFALYSIEQEVEQFIQQKNIKIDVSYLIGSVTDVNFMENIFSKADVSVVYHAAAYKHVPLSEANASSTFLNNVIGTKCTAELAAKYGVKHFVLVSTDKAVRPTNIMGATKRLAELVIQSCFDNTNTIFCIVRFGNVLGSSGSVIPKFRQQILKGGPVTVTHKDITRYFMSIPEASNLVLHAGALAKGGEVFLLDMGSPVKITKLAETMIRQHGLKPELEEINLEKQSERTIRIKFTGLRPGEKLYEELLIDAVAQSTAHPQIFCAVEKAMDKNSLCKALDEISVLADQRDDLAVVEALQGLPLAFKRTEIQEIEPIANDRIDNDRIVNDLSRNQNFQSDQASKNRRLSSIFALLVMVLEFKFVRGMLHNYFLFVRGMTMGVRIAVFNNQNEVLLVKHSYEKGWFLPGGGVDRGENILDAVKREVFEETGLTSLEIVDFPSSTDPQVMKRNSDLF